MDHVREAAIRARAYQLWIESGYADGQQDKHWRRAEREIAERMGEPDDDDGKTAARKDLPEAQGHRDGTSPHPSVLDAVESRE